MKHVPRSAGAIHAHACLLLVATCCALAGATDAHAQTTDRWSIGLNLDEAYANNPFLEDGKDHGSVSATFGIAPTFVLTEPTATTSIGASYNRAQYFQLREHTDAYSGGITHSRQLDERTNFSVAVTVNSSIPAEAHYNGPTLSTIPEFPSEPGTSTDIGQPAPVVDATSTTPNQTSTTTQLPSLDPSLIGSRLRQTVLALTSGLSTGVGARGSLALNLHANRSWSGTANGNYHSYGETLSFGETLSARSTVGINGSVERTTYDDSGGRDAMFMQSQLTYSRQIGPRFNVNAALGAVLIKNSGQKDAVTVSGSLSACRAGEYDNLCFSLSRAAYPSVEGGVTTQFAGAMNYSYRLGPRNSLTASISYARTSAIAEIIPATEYLTTGLSWSEQINQRLSGGVTASARSVTGATRSAEPDYGVRAYLSFTLGRLL